VRLKYLRIAECNSAIQQIENLRYVAGAPACTYTNRTNFLQGFYKLRGRIGQNEIVGEIKLL